MTQDDVIETARFAGITIDSFGFQSGYIEEFVAFAHLVAAKKQERIIEVVERLGTWAHITEVVAEIRGEA